MATKRRRGDQGAEPEEQQTVRLDQWLWAARFYKTRALAAAAVDGGKVELNGARPKRAHPVRQGDLLRIRTGPYEHLLTVRSLAARRGPAAAARELFEEDATSLARRAEVASALKAADAFVAPTKGRPTKYDRRQLARLKDRK